MFDMVEFSVVQGISDETNETDRGNIIKKTKSHIKAYNLVTDEKFKCVKSTRKDKYVRKCK